MVHPVTHLALDLDAQPLLAAIGAAGKLQLELALDCAGGAFGWVAQAASASSMANGANSEGKVIRMVLGTSILPIVDR